MAHLLGAPYNECLVIWRAVPAWARSPHRGPSVCASLHQPTPVERAYWFLADVNTCKIIQFRPATVSYVDVVDVQVTTPSRRVRSVSSPCYRRSADASEASAAAGAAAHAWYNIRKRIMGWILGSFIEQKNNAKHVRFYRVVFLTAVTRAKVIWR